MYKKILFHIIPFVLFLFSCNGQRGINEFGTLKGVIGIFEGNCMPSPNSEPCRARPISTTIFVTSPAENFKLELLKDSIITNSKGEFMMKLPVGSYSLFIRDGKQIICDGFNCEKECYCTPFQIQSDTQTSISANIDHAAR